jgi:peptidyl-tRNA hydrolase, PTH2 family
VPTKQVIVVRKDLKMRRGKEIAQGSHGAVAFLSNKLRAAKRTEDGGYVVYLTPPEEEWIQTIFKKICLGVGSEAELLAIHEAAKAAGLTSHLITDAGLTEFNGVPTNTVVCIGPDEEDKINAITGKLSPY